MKAALVFALTAAACVPGVRPIEPTPAAVVPLAADIDTLVSPAFGGRQAGMPGADSAADFLARRFERLGLRPAFHASYLQVFRHENDVFHNVGAIVEGLDSTRRAEYVVIGAHFDHLGDSPTFALDRSAGYVMRPGADDNASGTAAVLELARRFANHPAKRSIVFVNFDAEEIGLVGSRAWLVTPPVA